MKRFAIHILIFCLIISLYPGFPSSVFALSDPGSLNESIRLGTGWKIEGRNTLWWSVATTEDHINDVAIERLLWDYNAVFTQPAWGIPATHFPFDPFDQICGTNGFIFANIPDAYCLNNNQWLDSHYLPAAASSFIRTVPEPATMLLLGVGLLFLAGLERKFRKK